jgi:hypothetical protein
MKYLFFGSFFPPHGATTSVGRDLPIIEASCSHSDAPHSVGLLWTNDQPYAETSTRQHTAITRHIHALDGIRTNPSLSSDRRPAP